MSQDYIDRLHKDIELLLQDNNQLIQLVKQMIVEGTDEVMLLHIDSLKIAVSNHEKVIRSMIENSAQDQRASPEQASPSN